jgi:hypothetical protein
MAETRFESGMARIVEAVEQALHDRQVGGATVTCSKTATGVVVSITTQEQTHSHSFSTEEVEDSGSAIDAPSAQHVRMLVSHFVG